MKNLIIFYPSYERGGATKVLINLVEGLSKKNIQIYLITNDFHHNYKNLNVIKLNNKFNFLKTRFFSSLLGSIKLIKLINKLNKKNTKVLSMQSSFFSVFVCFILNFKIIVRVSEDPCGATKFADNKLSSYIVFFSKFLTYNLATSVVVNAKKSFLCLKKIVVNKKKIKILLNPSLKKIHKFKTKKNKRVILNIGRYSKQKNQIMLIKGFAQFSQKFKNYKLILCGDGPDKDKLTSLINDLKLSNKIFLKNWKLNIDKIYKNSSIFVLTSLYEGMPNALIEALNNNLPCISTNVSGVSDLLLSGKGGVILKNFKTSELENKLVSISENYSMYLNKTKYAKRYLKRYKLSEASNLYFNYLYKV